MYTTLISTSDLVDILGNEDLKIVDCRFRLNDPGFGLAAHRDAHIPGAVYAHLGDDLSSRPTGQNGRHPLPNPAAFTGWLSRNGIGNNTQVVAYDDNGGGIAARLWWLLRYYGHNGVAVLDGGWQAWQAQGLPVASGDEAVIPVIFAGRPDPAMLAFAADVAGVEAGTRVIDSRASERYRGEHEPIDPVAGHIPGAVNLFWKGNLGDDGRFLGQQALRERFAPVLGEASIADAIVYCGSGVTACQNLLALAHAGVTGARLYPGSWSAWSSDPERPVATGDEQ